jgi:hypothetical protein
VVLGSTAPIVYRARRTTYNILTKIAIASVSF